MGLLRTMGRTAVISGTATAVSNRVSRRQAGRWAAQAEQQAAPAAAPAAGSPGYVAELQQLAQLRDSGVISTEDFEAKKRQLLGL